MASSTETVRRCQACYFPVIGTKAPLVVCQDCELIADGKLRDDGTDPAVWLTSGDIRGIRMKVTSVRHWQEIMQAGS